MFNELLELNNKYFNAIDSRDFARLGDCFTLEAHAQFLGGRWDLHGRLEIVEKIQLLEAFSSTTHVLGNADFSIVGDEVQGQIFALAFLATTENHSGSSSVLCRGLAYRDRYVERNGRWEIAERLQHELWQFNSDRVIPSLGV